jgi:hypothetical protein
MGNSERDERQWNLLGVKHRGGQRGVSVAGPALPVGEYVEVVPASQLEGAVLERDALAKLVALYREYGSPDLTRMVNREAMRTPPTGGR